jgi:membrane protein YdbS with pleckstrin-like domain
MTKLSYRCPHCRKREEVDRERVGSVNTCSECGKPYMPEVPIAHLMQQRDDGQWAVASAARTSEKSPGETTMRTVHPAMFRARPFRYLLLILGFIFGLVGVFYFAMPGQGSAVDTWWRPITIVLSIVCAIVALASLISWTYWFVHTRFESLTITNERSVWSRGVFDRESSEVQHDDVRNIQVKQTLLDRILGVGRLGISSAGQDDMEIDIRDVTDPDDVAETIRTYQARMEGRGD